MASWNSRFNEPVPIERVACFWIFSILPNSRSRFSPVWAETRSMGRVTEEEKIPADLVQQRIQEFADSGGGLTKSILLTMTMHGL